MPTRFDADSSSEIWQHLNQVDQVIPVDSLGDIASPTRGLMAVVGTGSDIKLYLHTGAAWREIWPDDTGDVPLTVDSGTGVVRRVGRLVQARIETTRTSTIDPITTIPVGFRPSSPVPLSVSGTSGTPPALAGEVRINGTMLYRAGAGLTGTYRMAGMWIV